MLKSAHFVFWTKCAASSRNRLLFCPYIGGLVCKWERQAGPPLKKLIHRAFARLHTVNRTDN